MPWFPEFSSAAELARREIRIAGQADPVAQYFTALNEGRTDALEVVWPGEVVIHDPRAGVVRGHRELRTFVQDNRSWLAEHEARIEIMASTVVGPRAVVELLAHVRYDGREVPWPMAVVAESPDDRSVVFRTYCSQWPVDGRRHVRPPVFEPGHAEPGDVVGRHLGALASGDTESILKTFVPDGYVAEPIGPDYIHRGADELRSFYTGTFSEGGGIGLQNCTMIDDGVRCALEYNLIAWGTHAVPPQAGIAVYERSPDGLLAAVRIYDDVEPPDSR
ncbi:nuclear transport factor 2 family protein [Kribbella sp. NPDC026596]|uniref:nuclear transport factor 2 family protein n=1 Tax=Kribbella sp. NPDC026596 TaxID=3155122 RepID=UPI0033EE6639